MLRALCSLLAVSALTAAPALARDPDPTTHVLVFTTAQDLGAGTPTAELDVPLIHRNAPVGFWGAGEPVPVTALDLKRREARELVGHAFAFEADGRRFVRSDAPTPGRGNGYYEVHQVGDAAWIDGRDCYWVVTNNGGVTGGYMQCDRVVTMIDLRSGTEQIVTRRALQDLLADAPDLAAAFDAERTRYPATVRDYLVRYLERRANQG